MKSTVQVGLICLVLGAVGIGIVNEVAIHNAKTEYRILESWSAPSDLNGKIASVLSKRTLADHEVLFKTFKGLSEYCSNANRLNTTVDAYKAVAEVMVVYDIKGKYPEIADIVDSHLSPLKTPAKLVDKKDEVIRLFNELAEAIKYSAEKLPKKEK